MKAAWAFIPFALALALALAVRLEAQDQQVGARAKAMGGSYTAFKDDPVLVWLNPAGIAAQPSQVSIAYQTYTAYPLHEDPGAGPSDPPEFSVEGETVLADPEFIPSYLGFVFPIGTPESPCALGICYARPYLLRFSLDELQGPNETTSDPEAEMEQSLSRLRVAIGKEIPVLDAAESVFLQSLSFGIGLDLGLERWRFTDDTGDRTGTSLSFGFGFGLLVEVFDLPGAATMNLGVAYQSPVTFDFAVDPARFPAFDMPEQVNAGATVYLTGAVPLRLTVDVQFLEWSRTAQDPVFAGYEKFRDAVNWSVGAEYKIEVSSNVLLFPRAGFRRFQAPWEDENDLPATGRYRLVLDTEGGEFGIVTFGLGIAWSSDGKNRALDLAGDAGGDSTNVAVGYTHEF